MLQSKPLNVEYLMMDASVLLPPTGTPLTGIDFVKRLPCGDVEKTRRVGFYVNAKIIGSAMNLPLLQRFMQVWAASHLRGRWPWGSFTLTAADGTLGFDIWILKYFLIWALYDFAGNASNKKTMSPTVNDEFRGWLVEILVIIFADRAQG